MKTVPFGKYKGLPIQEMLADTEYVEWLKSQPWFRNKFAGLLSNVEQEQIESTPEHNKLQALFLNENYCRAFVQTACPITLAKFKQELHDDYYHKDNTWVRQHYKPPDDTLYVKSSFEHNNRIDVVLTVSYYQSRSLDVIHLSRQLRGILPHLTIEIKPTVGDDYPSVLRQMQRHGSRFLFTNKYIGEGVSRDEFVQLFRTAGIAVVFKANVDKAFSND